MNLPDSFEHTMRRLLGDTYDEFRQAMFDDPAVSIRLNRAKWREELPYECVPWAADGYYLTERPQFTFDPLLHAGSYYVQEASSMFVEQALKQHGGDVRVALDLCAAPGGKSTLLRSLLPDDCVLVSNEVMRQRAQVLVENIIKWGHPRCLVTSNYPADFTPLRNLFDLILVDAPCSGEGMFRKDEVAVSEWSPANVEICKQRQRGIITDIWPTLRPGGLLIYSTCTFNTEEDEENVRWMTDTLGAQLLPIDIDPAWGITSSLVSDVSHVYRFIPGRTRGEGFFLAVLQKPFANEADATLLEMKRSKKGRDKHSISTVPPACKQWLVKGDDFTYRLIGSEVVAVPTPMVPLVDYLAVHLNLLKQGIVLAEVKGRDAIPAHELAMSTVLNREIFPQCELSYAEALRYLHRDAIALLTDSPRGFVLVTWRGIPLGFVKHLGNRANNLYPHEWRIRSSHFPEEEIRVV